MASNFQMHKRADAVKWALTLIAFIIVGVLLAGIIVGWFNVDTDEDEEVEAEGETASAGGMVITPEEGSGAISLSFSTLSATSSDGTLVADGDTVVITATVGPDNDASNTGVDWLIGWADSSNSWASGKSVSDYLTFVTAGDDYVGSKTVTVTRLQQFGAAIVVTAVSWDNPDYTAAVQFDCARKILDFGLSFGDYTCVFGGNTGVTVEVNANGMPTGGVAVFSGSYSGVYSLDDTFTVSYTLSAVDTPFLYCNSAYYRVEKWMDFGYTTEYCTPASDTYLSNLDRSEFLAYSVSDNGLYFGLQYFYDYMGLNGYYRYYGAGTGEFPLTYSHLFENSKWGFAPSMVIGAFDAIKAGTTYTDSSNYTWECEYMDLFTLTVTVEGAYSSLTKSTTFVMNGYTNTSVISSVFTDYSSVIF